MFLKSYRFSPRVGFQLSPRQLQLSRLLSRNIVSSLVQMAFSAGVMFLLYRYLLARLGPSALGLWSLVLATTSTSRVAELGLTASLVRYVSKYSAVCDEESAREVIETALLTLGCVYGAGLALAFPGIEWLLRRLIAGADLPTALLLLPFSLISLWLNVIQGALASALDGINRTDIRAGATVMSNLIFLVCVLILVPRFGLTGVAIAQIGTSCLAIAVLWPVVVGLFPGLPWFPSRFRLSALREMLGYGLNFQAISVIAMLFDPITKGFLAHYGGLPLTGYYELASRLVLQCRSLMIAPSQASIAMISGISETESDNIPVVYAATLRAYAFLSTLLYPCLIAAAPLFSYVMTGAIHPSLILFIVILSVAWWGNTLSAPAYFINMGTGDIGWNTISHLAIGLLNTLLGFLCGSFWGAYGVVVGWSLALIIGSSIVNIQYHLKSRISQLAVFPRESYPLLLASGIVVFLGWIAYTSVLAGAPALARSVMLVVVFLLGVALPAWRHPLRLATLGFLTGSGKVTGHGNDEVVQ